MDKRHAKFLLQSCRGIDAAPDEPQFREARECLENDGELASWFEIEKALDDSIAKKLRETPVPESLRLAILANHAGANQPGQADAGRRRFVLLAAAALFMALAAAGFLIFKPASHQVDLAAFRREMTAQVAGGVRLSFTHSDATQLRSWLEEKRGIAGYTIPAALLAKPGIGCRSWTWNGRPVGLICFHIENGRAVHFFVVDKAAVPDAPSGFKPQFAKKDGWTSAAWSDGERLFLLVGEGESDELVRFL